MTESSSPSVQYLSIQRCKRVFWHQDRHLLRCADMLSASTIELFGLEPLLVIGLISSDQPKSIIRYCRASSPVHLGQFIIESWALDGAPERLLIDKRLREVLEPSFLTWLSESIIWQWSDGNRQFSAKCRVLQEFPDVSIPLSDAEHGSNLKVSDLGSWQHLQSMSTPGKPITTIFPESFGWDPLHRQLFCHTSNDVDAGKLEWVENEPNPYFWSFGFAQVGLETSNHQEWNGMDWSSVQRSLKLLVEGHPFGDIAIASEFGLSRTALYKKISKCEPCEPFIESICRMLGIRLIYDIQMVVFFQPIIFHMPPTATTASLEELVDFLCINDLIWLNSATNMEFKHPAIAVSLDELCPIILHFDPHKLSAAKGPLISPLGELVKQKPVIVSDGLYQALLECSGYQSGSIQKECILYASSLLLTTLRTDLNK